MVDPSEPAIARRIAGGEAQAESEFFERFGEQIKLMVWARLKRRMAPEEREDLVSEVNQAVLLSLRRGGYDASTGAPLAAYIAGIAAHVIGQYFRRQKKESFVESGARLDSHPDSENILSDLLDVEHDRMLRKCLRRLPSKYKEVLLLRIYEQHSIEEISQSLGVERRRVSERIHYAFQLLAKECRKENYFQY